MVSWISTNLANIALIAAIVLIVGMLIRVMVRDRRAGKAPCGGNCASCGACHGCDGCSRCDVTPSGGDDGRRNMNQL